MKGQRIIFLLCIILSTVICGAIYGIYFDSLSETEMMQVAYLWIFLLVVGIAGLIKKRLGVAVISGVVAIILLFIFYSTIWPNL